jgi:hypothetical protein
MTTDYGGVNVTWVVPGNAWPGQQVQLLLWNAPACPQPCAARLDPTKALSPAMPKPTVDADTFAIQRTLREVVDEVVKREQQRQAAQAAVERVVRDLVKTVEREARAVARREREIRMVVDRLVAKVARLATRHEDIDDPSRSAADLDTLDKYLVAVRA